MQLRWDKLTWYCTIKCKWFFISNSQPFILNLSWWCVENFSFFILCTPLSRFVWEITSSHYAYCVLFGGENKMVCQCRRIQRNKKKNPNIELLEIEMPVKVLVETWKLTSNNILLYLYPIRVTFSLTLSFLSAAHDTWSYKTRATAAVAVAVTAVAMPVAVATVAFLATYNYCCYSLHKVHAIHYFCVIFFDGIIWNRHYISVDAGLEFHIRISLLFFFLLY